MHRGEQMKIRLPSDLKAFVADQAERYGNSQNAEIIRAVRERMDRMQAAVGEKLPGTNPTAGHHETGFPAGPATHG